MLDRIGLQKGSAHSWRIYLAQLSTQRSKARKPGKAKTGTEEAQAAMQGGAEARQVSRVMLKVSLHEPAVFLSNTLSLINRTDKVQLWITNQHVDNCAMVTMETLLHNNILTP